MDLPEVLTPAEAERLLGIKAERVRKWASRGRLQVAGARFVSPSRARRVLPEYRAADVLALAGRH